MLGFQLHGHRQQGVDGRLEIPAGAEGVCAARHQESAALFANEEIEGLLEIVGKLVRGDVVEHDRARAAEQAGVEVCGVGDGFHREIQCGKRLRHGIVLIARGENDARAAGDLDPAGRAVVAGVGVVFGPDFRLVFVAAGAWDAVGEFDGGEAVC